MSNKQSKESVNRQTSSQFNARLPQITHAQINNLVDLHGLTKTQVIIVAVDRLSRDLDSELVNAEKDIRRLKTVARIAPQVDLGQED